jgi:hypothetical protein
MIIAAAVVVFAGACGDSGDKPELSKSRATSLRAHLSQISQSVRDGNCTTAEQATSQLQTEIDGLPGHVSRKLRRALSDSAVRLGTLVRDQCKPVTAPAPVTSTPDTSQETDQADQGKQENQDKSNKDKKNKEKSKEVPPGQQKKDGSNGTTSPGEQGGTTSPDSDTGGASP